MLEAWIEAGAWMGAAILFFIFVPMRKLRLALLGFFIMQTFTWPFGYMVIEFDLISYPKHFFADVSKTSFTFEYFVFPVTAAIFNLYYPKKRLIGLLYTSVVVSILTGGEVILEKFTDNIEYHGWKWYWSWITMFLTLQMAYWVWNWILGKDRKGVGVG